MTEEEYFRKNYPDSCYGDRPLSPHFDFFQDGVEFGERQSEEKIAELEAEVVRLRNEGLDNINNYTRFAETDRRTITELEKENAELKDEYRYWLDIKDNNLTKAKELLNEFMRISKASDKDFEHDYSELIGEAEQFLKDKTEQEEPYTEQEEPYYVILNMNCQYEICRKCPKSGLFFGTYEECEEWIREKESEVEK